jgi:hypothetical protein
VQAARAASVTRQALHVENGALRHRGHLCDSVQGKQQPASNQNQRPPKQHKPKLSTLARQGIDRKHDEEASGNGARVSTAR